MAYLYQPQHVVEMSVTLHVKLSDGGERNETVQLTTARNGKEITNQLTDTVLSAMHLALAVKPTSEHSNG